VAKHRSGDATFKARSVREIGLREKPNSKKKTDWPSAEKGIPTTSSLREVLYGGEGKGSLIYQRSPVTGKRVVCNFFRTVGGRSIGTVRSGLERVDVHKLRLPKRHDRCDERKGGRGTASSPSLSIESTKERTLDSFRRSDRTRMKDDKGSQDDSGESS